MPYFEFSYGGPNRARFLRVALKRVEDLLDGFDKLGACSTRSSYEYSEEDVEKIFFALQDSLDYTKSLFLGKKPFSLSDPEEDV